MNAITLCETPEQLGRLARGARQQGGYGLRELAPIANTGTRFLSEFERGKPTTRLDKVMDTLHAVGLDLAVIKREGRGDAEGYSRRLGTEFPYDWSNRQMDEGVFIRKVLKASRFNDVLKTVAHFGLDRVNAELHCLKEPESIEKVIGMIGRIQMGMAMARVQARDTAS